MLATSDIYKELFADPSAVAEYKVLIDGNEYAGDQIVRTIGGRDVRPQINGNLFSSSSISVGGAASRTHTFTVYGSISGYPRMASVVPYVRLSGTDGQASEWVQCGFFRIDSRRYDPLTRTTDVIAFDLMMLTEQSALETIDGNWPRSGAAVVDGICDVIGVELDDRTIINSSIMIDRPEDRNVTLRQMLGWIGAASGGNWTITNTGKLRLVTVAGAAQDNGGLLLAVPGRVLDVNGVHIRISTEDTVEVDENDNTVRLGQSAQSLNVGVQYPEFSGVQCTANGVDTHFVGDKTGYVLTVDSPYATEGMANNIMQMINAKVYQPFNADGVLLDPAAELGDVVTIGSYTSMIATETITFGTLCTASISAPGDEEIDREFPRFEPSKGSATKADIINAVTELQQTIEGDINNITGDSDLTIEELELKIEEIVGDSETTIEDIELQIDSLYDVIGSLYCIKLDFSDFDNGSFTETTEDGTEYTYGVEFTGGAPTKIFDDDHEMEIVW